MRQSKFFILLVFSITVTFGVSLAAGSLLAAWTAPASTPPDGNTSAPINTSATGQAKQGGLILNTSGSANGLIVQSGNVGIGTANPSAKLDVLGAGGTNVQTALSVMQADDGAGHAGGKMSLVSEGWGEWGFYVGDITNSANRIFYGQAGLTTFKGFANGISFVDTNTNPLMRISNNGNVGIGTTSPQAKLDVNGNIITSTPTANNHVTTKAYVDAAVAAAGGGTCSDSVQEGTWFSQGGDPRYCQKRVIDANGVATITNINQGLICQTGNGFCQNGTCFSGSIAFYPASTSNLFGGRAGADTRCLSSKPAGLTCSKLHAFLSVNANDEIRDMPANYGYSTDKVIAWYKSDTGVFTKFGNNWADILDGSIDVSAYTALGISRIWTGSTSDGQSSGYNCAGYNTYDYAYMTTNGNCQMTNSQWIDYSSTDSWSHCNVVTSMLCVCE